jgi:hypothetical protein
MQKDSDDQDNEKTSVQGPNVDEESSRRGLRDIAGAARETLGRSFDRISGAEFRGQFEDFTNAVSTTVVGVHRDQAEIVKKFDELQKEISDLASSMEPQHSQWYRIHTLPALMSLILSVGAVVIGVIALLRTL